MAGKWSTMSYHFGAVINAAQSTRMDKKWAIRMQVCTGEARKRVNHVYNADLRQAVCKYLETRLPKTEKKAWTRYR